MTKPTYEQYMQYCADEGVCMTDDDYVDWATSKEGAAEERELKAHAIQYQWRERNL